MKTFSDLRKGDILYYIEDFKIKETEFEFSKYDGRYGDFNLHCESKVFYISIGFNNENILP